MTPFGAFVGVLLATGLMRLGELVVSVRRMRARPDAIVAEPWLFPAMAALHTGLVAGPIAEVLLTERLFNPWIAGVSATVLCLATALRVWTLATIGRSWNVRVVRPAEDGIATTGPYAWIRHPNYLVVILEIAALPMLHNAWISALVLSIWNAAVLVARIRTEERTLGMSSAWNAAMSHKPRFIPGLF